MNKISFSVSVALWFLQHSFFSLSAPVKWQITDALESPWGLAPPSSYTGKKTLHKVETETEYGGVIISGPRVPREVRSPKSEW